MATSMAGQQAARAATGLGPTRTAVHMASSSSSSSSSKGLMVLDAAVQGHMVAATKEHMEPLEVAMGSGGKLATEPALAQSCGMMRPPASCPSPPSTPTRYRLLLACQLDLCKPRRRSVQSAGLEPAILVTLSVLICC